MSATAVRPYVTAGLAVLTAGAVAVAPVAPPIPSASIMSVELTGLVQDAIDFVTDAGTFLNNLDPLLNAYTFLLPSLVLLPPLHVAVEWAANPLPILGTVLENQVAYIGRLIADGPAAFSSIFDDVAANFGNAFDVLTAQLTLGAETIFDTVPNNLATMFSGLFSEFMSDLGDPLANLQSLLAMPAELLALTLFPAAFLVIVGGQVPDSIADAIGLTGSSVDIVTALGNVLDPVGLDFAATMLQQLLGFVF